MRWVFELEMESSVSIDSSAGQVWEVLTDAPSWPRWCGVCDEVSQSPASADWAPGDQLSFRLRMTGVSVPFNVHITESHRPERLAWKSTVLTVTATRTFTLKEANGRTVVIDHKRFRSAVLPVRLFYPRWIIRNMTEAWLRDLKAEVERRATGDP